MRQIKVPSVQHLARNWNDSPEKIQKKLVHVALNPPIFNYNPLHDAAREYLLFNVPEDQIIAGIKAREKRENVQKILLQVLPLILEYFRDIQPDNVVGLGPRFYPLGRDLKIPFKPNFLYVLGGQMYLPWFSFWKDNPLSEEQLSLFVTLALEMLGQDPDLETVKFQVLDFSADKATKHRSLEVIDANDVPLLNDRRKEEMLLTFVEGFEMANLKLKTMNIPEKKKETSVVVNTNQMNLWEVI